MHRAFLGVRVDVRVGVGVGATALVVAVVISMLGLAIGSRRASAHVIMGTKSIHLRVAESDLVVRGRVVDPAKIFVAPDGLGERSLVEITILETLKGKAESPMLRIVQDGHDVARYQPGQEALFFLRAIARSRELRMLAVPGGPTHVSSQEHDQQLLIEPPNGEILLSATRSLARSELATKREERVTLIRNATLDLLMSGDARLGAAGLASLVLTPHAEILTSADVPRLEKLLADPTVSIGLRAGLLAELERRRLVDGPSNWLALVQKADSADLPTAIRAAGAHPSPAMQAHLLGLLAETGSDSASEIAAEAAMALGTPGNDAVVDALAEALLEGNRRLRFAAVRGLGRIGSPKAKSALEQAARLALDAATKRRAEAELRSLTNRNARANPSD